MRFLIIAISLVVAVTSLEVPIDAKCLQTLEKETKEVIIACFDDNEVELGAIKAPKDSKCEVERNEKKQT